MLKAKNIIYGFCKYTNPPKYKPVFDKILQEYFSQK